MKLKSILKMLFSLKYSYITLLVALITGFSYSLALYSLSLMGKVIDNRNSDDLFLLIVKNFLIVILAWIFYTIMSRLQVIVNTKLIVLYKKELRKKIISKIESLEYSELKNKEEGSFLSWLVIDVENITSRTYNLVFGLIITLSMYISGIFFISLNSIYIGIACLIFSIFTVYLNTSIGKILNKIAKLENLSYEKYMNSLKNYVMGFDEFLYNNKQEILKNKVLENSDYLENNVYVFNMKMLKIEMFNDFISDIFIYIILISMVVLISIYNFGYALIFGVFPLLYETFARANEIYATYNRFRTATPILEKYDIEEKEDKKLISNIEFNNIELKNISFGYDKNVKVIENLSLDIKYPNKYYIVGESGKGKTTLIKLMQGLYKVDDGEVLIDGININNISEELIRNNISYLTQDIYLFNASIKENITLWGNYSEEEIKDVIKKCQLEGYINSLEKGLDTVIEENGKNVSGGQKQRIGLARLLIRKLKYIIIDEGTSQLDKENARKIEDILLSEKEITTIIITHHLRNDLNDRAKIINLN